MQDVVLDPALPAANQGLASLDALAAQAFALEPPSRDELRDLFRGEAGVLLDGLLVRVARGSGALEVAIGEGLTALAVGDRAMQLTFSSIGDYAQERLGIAPGTANAMERLARRLRDLPLLREAVRRGEVSARKALVVSPVARGDEERWVARARVETVRALESAVREDARASAAAGDAAQAPWDRVVVDLSADERARLDEAMALAGKVLGAGAPKWQRLEAICQEFLGAHPVEPGEDEEKPVGEEVVAWLESAKAFLEEEARQWEFLDSPALVASPETALDGERDPHVIDTELRRLAGLRDEWDDVLGHLAMLMKWTGLWKDLQFASFSHYCAERLGMAAKTVGQRAWLSRRLYSFPGLRDAMRAGRVSYEKARLVASVADDANVGEWIARAEKATCVALRREIEAAEERQMCVRRELDLRVPRRVDRLLAAAFRAAREAEGRWLKAGECLARIAVHFIATWKPLLKERTTRSRKVIARGGGWCTVPGCSRPAVNSHHIEFLSHGGSDDLANQTGMCLPHHLRGVHMGYIRVRGTAPDALTWELPLGIVGRGSSEFDSPPAPS
ncbi:MAG TPA: HNH endonuclease signature motif containing protein [Anaeromyxobacter sp.]|nr:HNH endonuclease signature motif containing protein [Anaeromyxobacter sp.]